MSHIDMFYYPLPLINLIHSLANLMEFYDRIQIMELYY